MPEANLPLGPSEFRFRALSRWDNEGGAGAQFKKKGPKIMALPHAKPGESVDLNPLGEALKDARTQAIIKTDSFEAIRLVLQAGTEIPSHKVPGEITLHCLEGCVSLGLTGSVINLRAGEWLYLNGGEPHSVIAEEDSSLLLTIILKT